MILGQSAATAAAMAIDRSLAVQDLPYSILRERLLGDGQVLENPDGADSARAGSGSRSHSIDPRTLEGTVIDDADAGADTDAPSSLNVERLGDW